MKKFLTVAVAAVLLVLTGIFAAAAKKYPEPTDRFFINDYAGVIDSSAEDEIYSRAAALYEKTGAQPVVAAVKNLGGEEPAEYALGLGRQWGVGDKKKNNGVVILFALEERQIYIAVGYGLEGALPDIKADRIIETYGLEYLKADNFSEGILQITKAVINEIYIEYGEEPEEGYTPIDDSEEDGYSKKVAVSWVALIAVVLLYLLIFGRRRRFFWFGGPGRIRRFRRRWLFGRFVRRSQQRRFLGRRIFRGRRFVRRRRCRQRLLSFSAAHVAAKTNF